MRSLAGIRVGRGFKVQEQAQKAIGGLVQRGKDR
jgi:polyhydroxyalkanoate synthesis regulator phasin